MIFTVFSCLSAFGQAKRQQCLDYIERYKQVALQHERQYGVPASITLAQGMLESGLGQSKMAREANNHFGIKAFNWQGEVYGGCDSLRVVGYRKYAMPEDSFLDHALVLKSPRYNALYQLDVNDYRSWAQGLRDCGYAEDASYPAKLINLIEQYELYALNGNGLQENGAVTAGSDSPAPDRWHHRKRRTRGEVQPQQQETPLAATGSQQLTTAKPHQGRVASSADND